MLSWTERPDGWYANGFRIELRSPRNWVLVDVDAAEKRSDETVFTAAPPLAVETTLSQCKREADILAAVRRRSELRRTHARVLLLATAAALLVVGQSGATDIIVMGAALATALRSLSIILGTLSGGSIGERHEIFYQ